MSSGLVINEEAAEVALLSSQEVKRMFRLTGWLPSVHTKVGSPTMVRMQYYRAGTQAPFVSDFVLFEHGNAGPRQRASTWWIKHGGLLPVPDTTREAMMRMGELTMPTAVECRRDGQYEKIVDRTFREIKESAA